MRHPKTDWLMRRSKTDWLIFGVWLMRRSGGESHREMMLAIEGKHLPQSLSGALVGDEEECLHAGGPLPLVIGAVGMTSKVPEWGPMPGNSQDKLEKSRVVG